MPPIQHVNKYVPLSVLVDIIYCFWANRTALLYRIVIGIVISFKDLGSAPIRLCPPTPDQPTMILSKHNRVTPNPIFPPTPPTHPHTHMVRVWGDPSAGVFSDKKKLITLVFSCRLIKKNK